MGVNLRCDMKHVQFDTPEGGNKITFLEMENKEAEQCLKRSSVRNNCERGAMRFNGNFEMWIMPKLKFQQSLHLGLLSLIAFLFFFFSPTRGLF